MATMATAGKSACNARIRLNPSDPGIHRSVTTASGARTSDARQRLVAAVGLLDTVTGSLEDLADHQTDHVDIIHHQNTRHHDSSIKTFRVSELAASRMVQTGRRVVVIALTVHHAVAKCLVEQFLELADPIASRAARPTGATIAPYDRRASATAATERRSVAGSRPETGDAPACPRTGSADRLDQGAQFRDVIGCDTIDQHPHAIDRGLHLTQPGNDHRRRAAGAFDNAARPGRAAAG